MIGLCIIPEPLVGIEYLLFGLCIVPEALVDIEYLLYGLCIVPEVLADIEHRLLGLPHLLGKRHPITSSLLTGRLA